MIHKGVAILRATMGKHGSIQTVKAEDEHLHLKLREADLQRPSTGFFQEFVLVANAGDEFNEERRNNSWPSLLRRGAWGMAFMFSH
jgi:hypothetical protein